MRSSVPGAVATRLWAWHTRPYRELRPGRIHHPTRAARAGTRSAPGTDGIVMVVKTSSEALMRFGLRSRQHKLSHTHAIRARLPAFRASIWGWFRGHPAPASFEAPSWRLSPTQPSAALAKHEPTGALSTLKLRLARRREIV